MLNKCPVCQSEPTKREPDNRGRDVIHFTCPLCGEYTFSRTLVEDIAHTLRTVPASALKISHAIRLMQQSTKRPELYTNTIEEVLKITLPKPKEQADLMIRWLGENLPSPGKVIDINAAHHMTIMGAKSPEGFMLVLQHLLATELICGHMNNNISSRHSIIGTLSFKGWSYYEELKLGKTHYRKAFMAMKFGDAELNSIVENVFKVAANQTGFDLKLLSDTPKAGLIDDRLRVEIQSSDFVLADLSHDNQGAYWEAGYAEGLGKPVIYTCKKSKFDEAKTHFDTNHHLTVVWDSENQDQATIDLKATIRATLPHLAKQDDR